MEAYQRKTGDNISNIPKRVANGPNWNNQRNKMKNIVLDYNLKYKINIHEFILI